MAGMDAPLQMNTVGMGGGMPPANKNVIIAHVAFKTAALISYVFSGFGSGYVVTFVMVTIFSALDFWTGNNKKARTPPLLYSHASYLCFSPHTRSEKCHRPIARRPEVV